MREVKGAVSKRKAWDTSSRIPEASSTSNQIGGCSSVSEEAEHQVGNPKVRLLERRDFKEPGEEKGGARCGFQITATVTRNPLEQLTEPQLNSLWRGEARTLKLWFDLD